MLCLNDLTAPPPSLHLMPFRGPHLNLCRPVRGILVRCLVPPVADEGIVQHTVAVVTPVQLVRLADRIPLGCE